MNNNKTDAAKEPAVNHSTRSVDARPPKRHLQLVPARHDPPIRETVRVRACLAPRPFVVLADGDAA